MSKKENENNNNKNEIKFKNESEVREYINKHYSDKIKNIDEFMWFMICQIVKTRNTLVLARDNKELEMLVNKYKNYGGE